MSRRILLLLLSPLASPFWGAEVRTTTHPPIIFISSLADLSPEEQDAAQAVQNLLKGTPEGLDLFTWEVLNLLQSKLAEKDSTFFLEKPTIGEGLKHKKTQMQFWAETTNESLQGYLTLSFEERWQLIDVEITRFLLKGRHNTL